VPTYQKSAAHATRIIRVNLWRFNTRPLLRVRLSLTAAFKRNDAMPEVLPIARARDCFAERP
jgi:hypothetical protein